MLDRAVIAIDCPACGCPTRVLLSRLVVGAGTFCPACQVHISFADERAGVRDANRQLEAFLREFPKTIEIKFEL